MFFGVRAVVREKGKVRIAWRGVIASGFSRSIVKHVLFVCPNSVST